MVSGKRLGQNAHRKKAFDKNRFSKPFYCTFTFLYSCETVLSSKIKKNTCLYQLLQYKKQKSCRLQKPDRSTLFPSDKIKKYYISKGHQVKSKKLKEPKKSVSSLSNAITDVASQQPVIALTPNVYDKQEIQPTEAFVSRQPNSQDSMYGQDNQLHRNYDNATPASHKKSVNFGSDRSITPELQNDDYLENDLISD